MNEENALTLENVTVKYGEGTPFALTALDDINIGFEKGKITGIIGHTGSGKSTLAQLTNGLLKPTSGKVLFGNDDIHQSKDFLNKVRFKVGLVFQYPEYQLFEETVLKDIMFGPKNMGLAQDDILRRAMSAAKFCGLDEEVLQSSPFEISGGQKRRAALAGVIAMEPDVLVLDEPAAGLDPRGRDDILGGITSFQKEVKNTMLLISHSMEDIARYADNILVLKNGKVFMSGTVENIFSEAIKIFDAGLDLPQITKLFIELQKRGVVDRTDIFTVAYAKKVLEQKIKI